MPKYQHRAYCGIIDNFSEAEVCLANRNHGTLAETLVNDITPTGMHYLLTHFDVPFLDSSLYRLELREGFENPLSLSLDDIRNLHNVSMPVTLECAGNGRRMVEPRSKSMPWGGEAVGTSLWTGVPLKSVIDMAEPNSATCDISFWGADYGYCGDVGHHFARSLSVSQLQELDALLVFEMNGQPLLPQHGAPLRLVVPGWYGMASVKWLVRIEASPVPFRGYQQVKSYNYRQTSEEQGKRVEDIKVNSRMVPPGAPDWTSRDRRLSAGNIEIFGRAWSGGGTGIAKVQFSVDGKWIKAKLLPSKGRYAWTKWVVDWQAEPGKYKLMCRAEDKAGNVQPLEPPWDIGGLGNNAVQCLKVTVV